MYAIGDVHGRLDLLERLLNRIEVDHGSRPDAQRRLVFLGDLIDRGPDSAGVVERLRQLARDEPGAIFLMGNHEEMFLRAIGGDIQTLRAFCRIGGRETLLSYGVDADSYERMSYEEVAIALAGVVPAEHLAFIGGFLDQETVGDYLFVHAGVDPARSLDDQHSRDLRWIRQPFLDHASPLAKLVVHGHTVAPEVQYRPHRIGIDTGAYQTGRLTALALDGAERWIIQT